MVLKDFLYQSLMNCHNNLVIIIIIMTGKPRHEMKLYSQRKEQ